MFGYGIFNIIKVVFKIMYIFGEISNMGVGVIILKFMWVNKQLQFIGFKNRFLYREFIILVIKVYKFLIIKSVGFDLWL